MEDATFVLPNGQGLKITLSVGFCVIPLCEGEPQLLNWEQSLALADAALYLAKAEGRNRWVGIRCGELPWKDPTANYEKILHNPRQAAKEGLIRLESDRVT
jgi:hypothetical protein